MNINSTQSELVAQLTQLNAKLELFINGDADTTIATTNGGVIKSIAGIARDLERLRYVQKVVDHRLQSDMLADTDIDDGMLVRVWGDTTQINGLYQKMGELGFVKISYRDLYDLPV